MTDSTYNEVYYEIDKSTCDKTYKKAVRIRSMELLTTDLIVKAEEMLNHD